MRCAESEPRVPGRATTNTPMADAASVLTVDVAAITAAVTKEALAVEQARVDGLAEADLFAEVASVEEELKKAMAALEKKKGKPAEPEPPATPTKAAPAEPTEAATSAPVVTFFEGTPIDCTAIADAIVAANLESTSDAELSEMVKSCEAELAKASAALAAKKSNPVTVPSTPTAAAKAPVAVASTPVAATKAPPAEKRSPLKKLGESATQLLEKAEETTGVDQKTLLTTGIATAIGVVVGVVGSLFRKR